VQTASYPLASSSAPSYAQISSYQQGYQPGQALVVVGPHFCLPYETSFAITKHVISLSHGDWTIIDSLGKKAFKVDGKVLSVRDRKYLRDAAGNKILQIRKKVRRSFLFHNLVFKFQVAKCFIIYVTWIIR
jgi:hypothetical protein